MFYSMAERFVWNKHYLRMGLPPSEQAFDRLEDAIKQIIL